VMRVMMCSQSSAVAGLPQALSIKLPLSANVTSDVGHGQRTSSRSQLTLVVVFRTMKFVIVAGNRRVTR
jgi:hypothetical protein